MQPLLFDEGLPGGTAVPRALTALGCTATTVGEPGAPETGSGDELNCRWCKANGAVLVTHDRGKNNREILTGLDELQVGAILVLKPMRMEPPIVLARAVLCAEGQIDAITAGRSALRHQLRASGKLVSPTRR